MKEGVKKERNRKDKFEKKESKERKMACVCWEQNPKVFGTTKLVSESAEIS